MRTTIGYRNGRPRAPAHGGAAGQPQDGDPGAGYRVLEVTGRPDELRNLPGQAILRRDDGSADHESP